MIIHNFIYIMCATEIRLTGKRIISAAVMMDTNKFTQGARRPDVILIEFSYKIILDNRAVSH